MTYRLTYAESLAPEAREALRLRVANVKPFRRRVAKPNYERARRLAEQRGEAAIERPDAPEQSLRATRIVRIYYRSMGGEVLAFDTAPMTPSAASALASQHGKGVLSSDALDSEVYDASQAPPRLTRGARLVLLPSQIALAVERIDATPAPAKPEPPQVPHPHPMRRYASYSSRRIASQAA